MAELPEFIDPMLARIGDPFDSPHHLFEVKWDGTRALAFVEQGGWRAHNRRRRDVKLRYPELDALLAAEPGLVLDGELVVLGADGRPEFRGMLQREQARSRERAQQLAARRPATYVVFDVLYRRGESLLKLALAERRRHLEEVIAALAHPRVVLSQGVVGAGCAFFDEIRRMQIEGMVAKDLRSAYRPGQRSDAWIKVKPVKHMHCAIVGYQLRDDGALKSVILAAPIDGVLRCVGRVGSGFDEASAQRLLELLRARPRARALIDCDMDGNWVEPGLFCVVAYFEQGDSGHLRAPVFHELIVEGAPS